MQTVKISEVKVNPNNPRLIKDDKFKKLVQSVKDFPEMLNIRPIVVNKKMVILGGNMRYKACKEAGLKEVPIIITDLSEEQQKEFLIKDSLPNLKWVLSDESKKIGDYTCFKATAVKEASKTDFRNFRRKKECGK